MSEISDKALEAFTEYFVRNYPGPDTVIFDPKWHAPKIFNAAKAALNSSGLSSELDRLREALLKISRLDYTRAAVNGCAYTAVVLASAALSHDNSTQKKEG